MGARTGRGLHGKPAGTAVRKGGWGGLAARYSNPGAPLPAAAGVRRESANARLRPIGIIVQHMDI